MTARSFVADTEGLGRALFQTKSAVGKASGGVVFLSGALGQAASRVADAVRDAWRGVPAAIVPAAGVLTERGEVETSAAASGVLWDGGKVSAFAIGDDDDFGDVLTSEFGTASGAALIFAGSGFSPDRLGSTSATASRISVFGAGAVGAQPIALGADGTRLRGAAVGLAIQRLAPIIRSSAACRLLTPLETIDEASDGLVFSIGGVPALDRLASTAAASMAKPGVEAPRPVVFAAIAEEKSGDRYVVRPIRGVDPTRKAVMVGPEARTGARFAFAVRDAAAARAGVDAMAREVAQQTAGSAPAFALYLTCAGRGQGLYGARDVESRILRQRFGDLPIAGMHSAFEMAPFGEDEPKLLLYSGVLALFRSPS